jgi:hypothetical protein
VVGAGPVGMVCALALNKLPASSPWLRLARGIEESDHRHRRPLLGPCSQRPRYCRRPQKNDELASSHLNLSQFYRWPAFLNRRAKEIRDQSNLSCLIDGCGRR